MFGLTFEKLFLVAVIAVVVLGPQRLPHYADQLARTVRAVRRLVEDSRASVARDLGVSLEREAWDLRQLDPRLIVKEALTQDSPGNASEPRFGPDLTPTPSPTSADEASGARESTTPDPAVLEQARLVRPGQRYLVTGPASHPRRISIASLAPDDPRRLAACHEPIDGSGETAR